MNISPYGNPLTLNPYSSASLEGEGLTSPSNNKNEARVDSPTFKDKQEYRILTSAELTQIKQKIKDLSKYISKDNPTAELERNKLMLEEMAGVYQQTKNNLQKKVQQLKEARQQALTLANQKEKISDEFDGLKTEFENVKTGKRKREEEYSELENLFKEKRSKLDEVEADKSRLKENLRVKEAELAGERISLQIKEKVIQLQGGKIVQLEEVQESSQQEISHLKACIHEKDAAIERQKEKEASLNYENEHLQALDRRSQQRIGTLEVSMQEKDREIQRLQEELARRQITVIDFMDEFSRCHQTIQKAMNKVIDSGFVKK